MIAREDEHGEELDDRSGVAQDAREAHGRRHCEPSGAPVSLWLEVPATVHGRALDDADVEAVAGIEDDDLGDLDDPTTERPVNLPKNLFQKGSCPRRRIPDQAT